MPLPDKKYMALSLSLHAAVFSGALVLDDLDQTRAPEVGQSLPYTVYQSDTVTLTGPGEDNNRATIMNMYDYQHFIPLDGSIDKENTERFIQHYQSANNNFNNNYFVTVITNSGGGNVKLGYAISDRIDNSSVPTRILCDKKAASMAAMILITTQNAFSRDATKQCKLMIHAPYHKFTRDDHEITLTKDDYADVEEKFRESMDLQEWEFPYTTKKESESGEELKLVLSRAKIRQNINKLEALRVDFARAIAEHSHLTEQDVTLLFEKGDVYFDAFEAKTLGLIDHIEGAKMDEIKAATAQTSICTNHPEISFCAPAPPTEPMI